MAKKPEFCPCDECPTRGDVYVCEDCPMTVLVVKDCECDTPAEVCLACCGKAMRKAN